MALVAYDYGSGSDEEEEENTNDKKSSGSVSIVSQEKTIERNDLFSSLPQSKATIPTSDVVEEDQIEDFIPKSKPPKEKVKITIPSLSEFKDVENEPLAKKPKPSQKGSGLLGLLPPVRTTPLTTKSFIPDSVKNKTKPPKQNTLVPHSVRQNAEAKKKKILDDLQKKKKKTKSDSDVESDDDFETPETFDDEMWEKVCGRPKVKPVVKEPETTEPEPEAINIAPEPERPYDGLDNQAFKELVGKTRRPIGNIKLIDINEEEILPEKDLWMTKSLTDPEMAPKPTVEDPVDPTRRKRHHITYLAQQAKANEQELANAWSASKNNRMMSRAKYGF